MSSSKPLDPPISTLINSLINLSLEQKDNVDTLFPTAVPNVNVEHLIEILDKSVKVYTSDDLEHLVSPLVTLLRKVYEIAPKDVQHQMQKLLLPSIEDRKQPLGRTESLSSRLLRLTTNISTPKLRDSLSFLLFELSDKDVMSFIQNVGYGFASGFLSQHNVPIPENALEPWSTSGGESSHPRDSQDSSKPINPITGQLLEFEPPVEDLKMTQEEKEWEAERLFVLLRGMSRAFPPFSYAVCANKWQRLKNTGVMNVQNPVEKAFQKKVDLRNWTMMWNLSDEWIRKWVHVLFV